MKPDSNIITARHAIVRLVYQGDVVFARWQEGRLFAYHGDPFAMGEPNNKELNPDKARLLAPCRPSKVVGLGMNYPQEDDELDTSPAEEPQLFLKPSTSVIGPGSAVNLPAEAGRVDYGAQIAAVIGRYCTRVNRQEAREYVLGYTCLNDITRRDQQCGELGVTHGKSYDTFCPLGPAIALGIDPEDCAIVSRVNGEVCQDSHTSDMIFRVSEQIAYISNVMALLPGDVIATGAPVAIGPVYDADKMEIEVEGIGILKNPVQDA
jgi:2-keto-4-pentenoate hydratase/2-oxohepta-3-ene-1,7-dioic acid hydratase in catechol pathway